MPDGYIDPQRKALIDALNQREQETLAKRPPVSPLAQALEYASKPFKGYWNRQGQLAREGLAMADQGAQQVRQGDLSGLAGMLMGPLGYVSSPVNALVPTTEEAYGAFDSNTAPFVAGGLELAALALPGPKGTRAAKASNVAEEGITAYHGSPHTFDKFDMSKIGTGEGAQAYGHGLYFAENEGVAKSYRDALAPSANISLDAKDANLSDVWSIARDELELGHSKVAARTMMERLGKSSSLDEYEAKIAEIDMPELEKVFPKVANQVRDEIELYQSIKSRLKVDRPDKGSMYQVRLNVKPDELLDWDRPLSQQSGHVQKQVEGILGRRPPVDHPGSTLYNRMAEEFGGARGAPPPEMTEKLKAAGIKGIRYKDAGSRDKDGGTYNYVIFDDKLIDILKRYAIPFTLGAGGAAIVSGQSMPPEVAAQLGPQG